MKVIIVLSAVVISCIAQRAPYAGKQPIGYPAIEVSTVNPLENRFGDDAVAATTIRLPIEALGDAELVNRLSKLPIDRQPFWLVNWRALEAQRNNPQVYPQRGNSFVDNMMLKR